MKAKSQSTYTALSQGKYKSIDFHWMSHNRGFPYKDMEVMTKKKKNHTPVSVMDLEDWKLTIQDS